jgi:cell division septation protein DedD
MVIDYSERKPVSKNRSKKQPVKLITLFITAVVLGIYSLGVASGWFLYKTLRKNPVNAPAAAAVDTKQKKSDSPQPGAQQNQTAGNAKINEPPLTFYQTLPKGEIVTLGTGMNPSRDNKPRSAVSAPQKTAGAKPRTQVDQAKEQLQKKALAEKDSNAGPTAPDTVKPGDRSGKKSDNVSESADKTSVSDKEEKAKKKYTVQVASCNLKKEAEEIKTSLDRKGLPAYVVESKVPGKGVRYRVRLGSRLDLETANKIAAKAGNGAILIPE